jgi:uncharacterized protein YjbI with pentapeptide repeats
MAQSGPVRVRIVAAPLAAALALLAVVLPAAGSAAAGSTVGASVTDVGATSATVVVDLSGVSVPGHCLLTVWANVDSVGSTPSFHKETAHTKASKGSRERFVVDGLRPNNRYSYTGTLVIHGLAGGDFAPCPDVSKRATGVQEFSTVSETLRYDFSYGVTVAEGVTHLSAQAKALPSGTSTIHIEYGPTKAYGTSGPASPCTASSCTARITFPPNPAVLKPGTAYHFRPVIQNQYSGRQVGPDDTFNAPNVCTLKPAPKANFTGCPLGQVSWANLKLEDLVLNGAQLPGADLFKANLSGSSVTGTNLSEADLRHAVLWHVTGTDTVLTGAKMQDVALDSGTSLTGAKLQGADLSGASMQRARLRGADLTGARFVRAVAAGADFSGATLTGANFDGAILDGATLPPSIAQAICNNQTLWPDHTRGHGTTCPPPTG